VARSGRRREVVDAFGSSVVLQACLLVSGVLAARILGPNDRGILALFLVTTQALIQVGTLGLPMTTSYELARGASSPGSLIRKGRAFVTVQTACLSALHVVAVVLLITLRGAPTVPALISLAGLPMMIVQGYGLAILQGCAEFRALHVLRIAPSALYALTLLIGAVAGLKGLSFVTLSWVGSFVVVTVGTVAQVQRVAHRRHPRSSGAEPASGREMISFGLRGLLGSVSPTETFNLDQLIVGVVLSTRDLGLYVGALALTNLPRFLAQGLGLVAYTRVAGERPSRQARVVWRFTFLGGAAAALAAAPLAAFAQPILGFAFGHAFESAATTVRLLLAGTVVLCVRRVLSECLKGAGAPGAGSRAEILSWLALAPALAALAPSLGIEGVAIALGISYAVSLSALLVSAARLGMMRRLVRSPLRLE
jgi:O-antigen/teichoic acid export membrane protein